MKVLTLGWMTVFLGMFLMNIYVGNQYISIPFESFRALKLSIYIVVHLLLIAVSIYYFYLFFTGNTDGDRTGHLSKISGFYITFINYALFFYLIYDLVRLTQDLFPYPEALKLFSGKMFFGGFLIFGLAALISLASLNNARDFKLKSYSLSLDKGASSLDSLNIVYLSDGHIGTSLNLDNIDQMINEIEELKPDAVFLGGDFFDEGTSYYEKLIASEKLAAIDTKYGVFAIEGNHEYKSGDSNIYREMKYMEDAGIKTLRDRTVKVDNQFYLIGRRDKMGKKEDLAKLVSQASEDLPVILLDHRPSFKDSINYKKIGLQISGHTHSGQFFPMHIKDELGASLTKQYIYGHHRIKGLHHIVSSGIGDWGAPIRIGSNREIVNIKIDFK